MYRKKTLTKSHDYGRLFSLEKRRLKMNEAVKFVQDRYLSFETRNGFQYNTEMTLYLGEKEDRFRWNNRNIILYVDFFFESVGGKRTHDFLL